ncbi:hypothetical protein NEOLEDRAFT_1052429, partial [Neolentinus lepideus HHB14362 ss-1]
PQLFELAEDDADQIQSILDCRKVGRRYEYYVWWKSLPESENSWIPLSELIEWFHRHHPHAP